MNNTEKKPLTYLEFYSGVGGWSFALSDACHRINEEATHHDESSSSTSSSTTLKESFMDEIIVPLTTQCLGAYDHSDLCHKVFLHNFPANDIISSSTSNDTRKDRDDRITTCEKQEEGSMITSCGNSNNCNNNNDNSKQRKKKKRKINNSNNHKSVKKPVAIEKLTQTHLEEMAAKIWMMSPPCQPHTRQHSKQEQDVNDPRSKSFLHLCSMILKMKNESLPQIILLENVVGFESSNSCKQWRHALFSRNYTVLHFHLNPPQFGIPNDRPRYYCVALHLDQSSMNRSDSIDSSYTIVLDDVKLIDDNPPINTKLSSEFNNEKSDDDHNRQSSVKELMSLDRFLDKEQQQSNNTVEEKIDQNTNHSFVSEKILSSNASWCFDIVTPNDKRSACFTHSYGKYVRGTGSVLYIGNDDHRLNTTAAAKNKDSNADRITDKFKLVSPDQRSFDVDWNGMDLKNKLRYFTGREMARLMGFPVDLKSSTQCFNFPDDCTEKQRWKLMGNSLNVKVASKLVEFALRVS